MIIDWVFQFYLGYKKIEITVIQFIRCDKIRQTLLNISTTQLV